MGIHSQRGLQDEVLDFFAKAPFTTRWAAEAEFVFSGLMRVMSCFMRASFPKLTQQFMQEFKVSAEGA